MAKKLKLGIVLLKEKSPAQDMLDYGKAVVDGMSTNADIFLNPVVSMKDLNEAVTALQNSIVPELKRSKETDLILDEKRSALSKLLASQSNYVLWVAAGDRTVVERSGFNPTKESTTPQNPTTLELKKATFGKVLGTVEVSLKDRAGCALFIVMLKDEDGVFRMVDAFNTINFTVSGLPSGESMIRVYGKKNDKVTPNLDFMVRAL